MYNIPENIRKTHLLKPKITPIPHTKHYPYP